MTYNILRTDLFERKFNKIDNSIQKEIKEIRDKLKENPFLGKPLDFEFFREIKIKKFRIYFLIYEEYKIVYMITISEKKDQQVAINTIRLFLWKYKEEIEDWIRKHELD